MADPNVDWKFVVEKAFIGKDESTQDISARDDINRITNEDLRAFLNNTLNELTNPEDDIIIPAIGGSTVVYYEDVPINHRGSTSASRTRDGNSLVYTMSIIRPSEDSIGMVLSVPVKKTGAKASVFTLIGHFELEHEHSVKAGTRVVHLNARNVGEKVLLADSKLYAYKNPDQGHLIEAVPLTMVNLVEQGVFDKFRNAVLNVHVPIRQDGALAVDRE